VSASLYGRSAPAGARRSDLSSSKLARSRSTARWLLAFPAALGLVALSGCGGTEDGNRPTAANESSGSAPTAPSPSRSAQGVAKPVAETRADRRAIGAARRACGERAPAQVLSTYLPVARRMRATRRADAPAPHLIRQAERPTKAVRIRLGWPRIAASLYAATQPRATRQQSFDACASALARRASR
jgi:hypothetical protein